LDQDDNGTAPRKNSARYDFQRAGWGAKIWERLKADPAVEAGPKESEASAFAHLAGFDPTREAKDKPYRYLGRLCEWYAAGAVSAEDLYKVRDNLALFDELKRKNKLPPEHRDIGRCADPATLFQRVKPFMDVPSLSLRDLKREERGRIEAETTVLYGGPEVRILIPHSEAAACFWGRGTSWCTAATRSDNRFAHYNAKGPLVVYVLPDGTRYQGHRSSKLMDAADIAQPAMPNDLAVLIEAAEKRTPGLNSFLERHGSRAASSEATRPVWSLAEALREQAICLEAVRQNGWALGDVPKTLRDREMCLEAVRQDGLALHYVPEALQECALYLEAVRHGRALGDVPKTLRDREMCLEAVRQNGAALAGVPKTLRDREMCLEAVRQNGRALGDVPKTLRDREMCLAAIRQDGLALRDVPEALQECALCLEAVRQKGWALCVVPEALRDRELYLEAVRQNGETLAEVPEALRRNAHAEILNVLQGYEGKRDEKGDPVVAADYYHLLPGCWGHPENWTVGAPPETGPERTARIQLLAM